MQWYHQLLPIDTILIICSTFSKKAILLSSVILPTLLKSKKARYFNMKGTKMRKK